MANAPQALTVPPVALLSPKDPAGALGVRLLSPAILFGSGFAGLGYEIVWTRLLTVGLGHEIVAVLSIVAAFFSGMALGAFWLDRPIARSARPARWYVGLEVLVGVWSLALAQLLPQVGGWLARWLGPEPSEAVHQGVAFGVPLLLLLPATCAMGATLPAVERAAERALGGGRRVAGLYASNTFGAVAGTLLCTFAIAPALGHQATVAYLAGVNLACAGVAWLALDWGSNQKPSRDEQVLARPREKLGKPLPFAFALVLGFTGLLGIGYEVLVVRLLSQLLENTVFSFAAVLALYLAGTAIGAALYQAIGTHRKDRVATASALLLGVATSVAVGLVALSTGTNAFRALLQDPARGIGGTVLAEVAVASVVVLVPTIFMGATFSHLAQQARSRGYGLGRALGINTLGGSLAPFLFGTQLLPALGMKLALGIVCLGYVVLGWPTARGPTRAGFGKGDHASSLAGHRISSAARDREPLHPRARVPLSNRDRRGLDALRPWMLVPAALAVWIAFGPVDLRFLDTRGERIVIYRDGVMASVSTSAGPDGALYLDVNHHRMGGTPGWFTDRRQAHLPLLLHPAPRHALFLGVGTGGTLAASWDYPGLQAVGVELVPEVAAVVGTFEPRLAAGSEPSAVRVVVSDARRYVAATRERFDVIVADLFHPARDGAGLLYTREHFARIRRALRPGPDSLFCQWLPLYQLDLPTLKLIVRTFVSEYPESFALLAHYGLETPMLGLVGHTEPRRYARDWFETRVTDSHLRQELARVRLSSNFELFGTYLGSGAALRDFAGTGPLNTDDRPLVTALAPRAGPTLRVEPPHERLLALLAALRPQTVDLLEPERPRDALADERLDAYWAARDEYLAVGVSVPRTHDPVALVRTAADPLLKVVARSPDFAPAYDPLLVLALRLGERDPGRGRQLLHRLQVASPQRPEAERALVRLDHPRDNAYDNE